MSTFSDFKLALKGLVEKGCELLEKGPLVFKGKPEDETKQRLVEPLLKALNYCEDDYVPEHAIKAIHGPVLGWVDYALQGGVGTTLAFVEAKGLFDRDLWRKYQGQIRKYVRDYLLTLDDSRAPVRWVFLTNFVELHVLNIIDRQPYFTLTYDQYLDNAERIWTLLERENLTKDLIFADYSESRRYTLGKEFLEDLKRWRLILANGYRASTRELTIDEAKALSQQLLDRLILVRVLETKGLQAYYSLVKEHDHWQRFTRNKDRLLFHQALERVFVDLELDLNTELFKDDLTNAVKQAVRGRSGKVANLAVPNDFLQATIVPDEAWSDRVRSLMKGTQLQFSYTTPYNYDFRTLTDDVIGSVYEQFLAHQLRDQNGDIVIESSTNLRQREGAYYTPTPVVRYLVAETLGKEIEPIVEEAVDLVRRHQYAEAKKVIDRLAGIRVVDIACGSGAFLIEAFDQLLLGYRRYNAEVHLSLTESKEGFAPLLHGGGVVSGEGERIVRDNLFGVDKDSQAVEVAKLNLWLKLLRNNPQGYTRSVSNSPQRLPELIRNLHVRDSLTPREDPKWLVEGAQRVVVVGNPPWGANTTNDTGSMQYQLAAGQYDSYELFVERALDFLPEGGLLGFIVPDSILHLPEHEPLRRLLLEKTALEHLVKLGEGVFEGVFRAAVALVLRKRRAGEDHKLSASIVVKADRHELLHKDAHGHYSSTIQDVEKSHGHAIRQGRFSKSEHFVFDIYTKDADEPVRTKINLKPINWEDHMDRKGSRNHRQGAGRSMSGMRCLE